MRQNIDFDETPYGAVSNSLVCDGQGLFTLKNFNIGDLLIIRPVHRIGRYANLQTFLKNLLIVAGG